MFPEQIYLTLLHCTFVQELIADSTYDLKDFKNHYIETTPQSSQRTYSNARLFFFARISLTWLYDNDYYALVIAVDVRRHSGCMMIIMCY